MKRIYILLFLFFIAVSCSRSVKSYFNIISETKESNNIKVVVEAKKSGRQSENIFLVTQFLNDDVIVNTSMSQIGPMMFDAGKYEFNVQFPTNNFTKYTNFIEEIVPEKAQRIAHNNGFGNSFFTYLMLMNLMDDRRPVYYDDYGSRRTINRDYYDDRYTRTRRSIFNNSRSSTAKKTTVNDNNSTTKKTTVNNNNSTTKRRTLFKPSSGSSTRKKSTFRGSSTRRRR